MSQYGGVVKHPETGRAYFVYALGAKSVIPPLPNGKRYRGPVHRHHIAQVAFKLIHPDGTMDSQRHIMQIPKTAIDHNNIYRGKHTFFYTKPMPGMLRGKDALASFTSSGHVPWYQRRRFRPRL